MTFLVYGADGDVGDLVARKAAERGLEPTLAGRDGDRLRESGRDLRCSVRAFGPAFVDAIDAVERVEE